MRKIIIPIFVPHKGCPHDCVFCDQKKISGRTKTLTNEEIRTLIKTYLDGIKEDTDVEIAFYGGSFTGINIEEQERLLGIANEFKDYISGIRASTRPDMINDEIISLLKEYNVRTIELGVQSMDEEVLRRSGRGHTPEDVYISSALLKNAGITLGIQTMLGLPGDNFDKSLDTCKKVIQLKPEIVRIYPTLVIRDTPLDILYKEGKYKPLGLDEAVEISSILLEEYLENNINVIRIGLLATSNVKAEEHGGEIVAGPYHPAFRQLVESRMVFRKICRKIEQLNLTNRDSLFILAKSFDPSVIIGQNKSNIKLIKDKYNIKKISVINGYKTNNSSDSKRYNFVI